MSTEHSKINNRKEKIPLLDGFHTAQNISFYSFALGTLFGIAVTVAFYSDLIPQLGIFLAAVAIFHEFEYILTALFNADKLSLDSFLLNNGQPYKTAHAVSMCEFLIELYLFPSMKNTNFARYLGLVILIIGQIARSLAMWHAKHNFSHQIAVHKREEHVLVKTGVYAYMRHPSYFGFFWWVIGMQVLLFNPICLVVFPVVLYRFFSNRIREEEPLLVEFFGEEYEEYRKKTPTLIPFIR
ncbi:16247_t:CDS:2 [Acaulospora morrowiae]|uniref:Protein-S-isoprenylcysteine O-methyltransferase n=1 Tax=Acaulospora morrowiae TaxID=94023 RepID=A0A9N8YQ21_9GLOM|nr:16247_t:CDS:2 [Acaulospora morrowiae]